MSVPEATYDVAPTYIPYVRTSEILLRGKSFTASNVATDDITVSGMTAIFAQASKSVFDDVTPAIQGFLTATGQTNNTAYNKGPVCTLRADGVPYTTLGLALNFAYNLDPADLNLGDTGTVGAYWTCPVGGDGVYMSEATCEVDAGTGITSGSNFGLAIRQDSVPVGHSIQRLMGTGTPFFDRTRAASLTYVKAGQVLSLELGAGYTNTNLTINKIVWTLMKLSGPITGVTG